MKCKLCDNKIPKGRLETLPDTRLCVKCSDKIGSDFVVNIREEIDNDNSEIVVTKVPRSLD